MPLSSLRVPLIEIVAAALFAFLATRDAFGPSLIALCFFTGVLLLIAVIDLEHKLILNLVGLPATLLALVASPLLGGGSSNFPQTLDLNRVISALVGAAVGYAITLGIYYFGVLFLALINRRRANKIDTIAFGIGDVKLAGLIGVLVGVPAILYALIYESSSAA